MADNRKIEYRIVGKDEASAVFKRVKDNAQKMARDTSQSFSFAERALGAPGLGDAGSRLQAGGMGRAAGGAIITEVGGRVLARAAASTKDMADQYARGEASAAELVEQTAKGLPLIGGWVSAGRDFRATLDTIINRERVRAEMREKEIRDTKELAQQRQRERAEVRRQQSEASDRRREGAEDAKSVSGTTGIERTRIQEAITLKRELEQIERETQEAIVADMKNGGQLKSKLEAEAQERREAAQAKFHDSIFQRQQQAYEQEGQRAEEHSRRMEDADRAAFRTRLEDQGRYHTARLADIDAAYKRELAEIASRQQAEMRDVDPNSPLAGSIATRANESRAAAEREHRRQRHEAEKAELDRRLEAQKQHSQAMLGVRTKLAADILRSTGKTAAAERAELDGQLQQTLAAIQQRVDREVRENAEDADNIRRRGAEEAQGVLGQYALNREMMQRRRAERYKADGPGAISGDTRLLTGQAGILGPLAEPTKQTAMNTRQAAAELKTLNQNITTLIATIGRGGLSAPPTN